MRIRLPSLQIGSNTGYTLVESLVALGLLGCTMLAAMTLSQNAESVAVANRHKSHQLGISGLITDRMKYGDLCATSLGLAPSMPIGTLNPTNINSELEILINVPGVSSGPSMDGTAIGEAIPIIPLGLKITSLKLISPVDVTPVTADPAANRVVMALLSLGVGPLHENENKVPTRNQILGAMVLDVSQNGTTGDPADDTIIGCHMDQNLSLRDMCTSFGCEYNLANDPPCTCAPPPMANCKALEYPTGIKGGQLVCNQYGGACPAGIDPATGNTVQYIVNGAAISDGSGGSVRCIPPVIWVPEVPLIPAADCTIPAGTTWTVGTNTCTSDAEVGIADSSYGTLVDSASSPTGQAHYSCSNGVTTQLPGATCAAAGCIVAADTQWTQGASLCNSDAPVNIDDGAVGTLTDTSTPSTGTASYSCSAGVATLQPGAVCSLSGPPSSTPPPPPTPPSPSACSATNPTVWPVGTPVGGNMRFDNPVISQYLPWLPAGALNETPPGSKCMDHILYDITSVSGAAVAADWRNIYCKALTKNNLSTAVSYTISPNVSHCMLHDAPVVVGPSIARYNDGCWTDSGGTTHCGVFGDGSAWPGFRFAQIFNTVWHNATSGQVETRSTWATTPTADPCGDTRDIYTQLVCTDPGTYQVACKSRPDACGGTVGCNTEYPIWSDSYWEAGAMQYCTTSTPTAGTACTAAQHGDLMSTQSMSYQCMETFMGTTTYAANLTADCYCVKTTDCSSSGPSSPMSCYWETMPQYFMTQTFVPGNNVPAAQAGCNAVQATLLALNPLATVSPGSCNPTGNPQSICMWGVTPGSTQCRAILNYNLAQGYYIAGDGVGQAAAMAACNTDSNAKQATWPGSTIVAGSCAAATCHDLSSGGYFRCYGFVKKP